MKTFFKNLFASFADHAQRREEAYLNEATSIADLEMRMRDIDRGLFRNGRHFA